MYKNTELIIHKNGIRKLQHIGRRHHGQWKTTPPRLSALNVDMAWHPLRRPWARLTRSEVDLEEVSLPAPSTLTRIASNTPPQLHCKSSIHSQLVSNSELTNISKQLRPSLPGNSPPKKKPLYILLNLSGSIYLSSCLTSASLPARWEHSHKIFKLRMKIFL